MLALVTRMRDSELSWAAQRSVPPLRRPPRRIRVLDGLVGGSEFARGCIERRHHFYVHGLLQPVCEFDGKLSVVLHGKKVFLYAR